MSQSLGVLCPTGYTQYQAYYSKGQLGNSSPATVQMCLTPAAVSEYYAIKNGTVTVANATYWWGTIPDTLTAYTGTTTVYSTQNGGNSYTSTTYGIVQGNNPTAIVTGPSNSMLASANVFGLPWYLWAAVLGVVIILIGLMVVK